MVGSNVNLPEEENTPEKRVERIFNLMDKVSFYLNYSFFYETRDTFWFPTSHKLWAIIFPSQGENKKLSWDPWIRLFEKFLS